MNADWRKWLFGLAAFYDGALGLAFLLFWTEIFRRFDVTPPNHGGYAQFPALLLLVFSAMFVRIARDPDAHRDLIEYGIGLKVAYSGLVFWYQMTSGVPAMWVPWAWIDVAFLVAFVIARQSSTARVLRPAHA